MIARTRASLGAALTIAAATVAAVPTARAESGQPCLLDNCKDRRPPDTKTAGPSPRDRDDDRSRDRDDDRDRGDRGGRWPDRSRFGYQPRGGGGGGGSRDDFDFYVLALSWSPSFCADGGEDRAREQCAVGANNGFVVHGLWPQYERGSPQNCDSRSPTRQQIDAAHGVYPDDGLARHEWRVHGTCSGKSPTEYFAAVKTARQAITIPNEFTAPKQERNMDTTSIARAFIGANKGLRLNAMAVTCRSGAIQEVRVCMSKDLRQFVTCQQVSRAGCRSRQVSVPPVR